MNIRILPIFCLYLCFVVGTADAQTGISNVKVEFSCPGQITITYDLNANCETNVTLYYSSNQHDWLPTQSVTGDLTAQSTGTGKTIVWNNVADNVHFETIYFKIEVTGCNYKCVMINGVCWATCNVDRPGTFAANPEDAGMFYQWNRKVGWSTTDPMINSNGDTVWNNTYPTGTEWETANDPCPCGWRVPTATEQLSLMNATHILTIQNGVTGWLWGTSPNTIFLPYDLPGGWRNQTDGRLYIADHSDYWTGTQVNSNYAYDMCFASGSPLQIDYADKRAASLVRCVKNATSSCSEFVDTVIVYPIKYGAIVTSICAHDSILFNGKYYSSQGTHTCTLLSALGCDSIVTLHLTVNPVYFQNESLIICENELPFTWRDTVFDVGTTTNPFVFKRTTVLGCDSIVTLRLTVNSNYRFNETKVICANDLVNFTWHNKHFTKSGIYYDSLKTHLTGCDSVYVLNLTVNPVYETNTSVSIYDGNTYFFKGEFLTTTGTYQDTLLSAHGCDSIVTLHLEIIIPLVLEISVPNIFTPNGDGMNDIFKPEINHPEMMKEYEMVIYDRWGRLVFTTQEYSTGWDGNNNHEQPCSTGVYYCLIHVTDMSDNTFTHHTSVTLIR